MPEELEQQIIRAVQARINGEVRVQLDQRVNALQINIRIPSIGNNELLWTFSISLLEVAMYQTGMREAGVEILQRVDRFAVSCRRQMGEELLRQSEAALVQRRLDEDARLRRRDRDIAEDYARMHGTGWEGYARRLDEEWRTLTLPLGGTFAADAAEGSAVETVTFEALAKTMKELETRLDKPVVPKVPPKKRCELIHEDPFS